MSATTLGINKLTESMDKMTRAVHATTQQMKDLRAALGVKPMYRLDNRHRLRSTTHIHKPEWQPKPRRAMVPLTDAAMHVIDEPRGEVVGYVPDFSNAADAEYAVVRRWSRDDE
ncbi:MAG: hypothetical protein CMB99_01160 [Flavobacteriaceae bacterium]|nr:hypothetical protein [Flavobacteriaceae bacterium]|tara:strand:+ start:257 stop:598 length:342 start_codon:yes stop_codon:yes gene_type:complete